MKNKRKSNPFFYMAITLLVLFVILIAFGISMFFYVFMIPDPDGLSLASWPNTFTDNFSLWMNYENGSVSVEEIGIERLNKYGLWIQIINESGYEIFSHNKPAVYPESYGMADLVSLSGRGYENGFTVFVNRFDTSDTTLSYLVGFPYSVGKSLLYYNGEHVARLSPLAKTVILLASGAIVLCGFVYSFWLSRKLSIIVGSIRTISQHRYRPLKETGVFGEVYGSLNQMDVEIRRSIRIQEETDRTRNEWISQIQTAILFFCAWFTVTLTLVSGGLWTRALMIMFEMARRSRLGSHPTAVSCISLSNSTSRSEKAGSFKMSIISSFRKRSIFVFCGVYGIAPASS